MGRLCLGIGHVFHRLNYVAVFFVTGSCGRIRVGLHPFDIDATTGIQQQPESFDVVYLVAQEIETVEVLKVLPPAFAIDLVSNSRQQVNVALNVLRLNASFIAVDVLMHRLL